MLWQDVIDFVICLQLCAVATAKLHMLVQTKLISSSAEASFLIGNLNLMVLKAVRGNYNTNSYSILLPFLTIGKYGKIWHKT